MFSDNMAPRPILKQCPNRAMYLDLTNSSEHSPTPQLSTPYNGAFPFASCHIPVALSPHVHFPPTPTLTRLGMTYSAHTYDRKPIEVSPNALTLPARGERDVDRGYFRTQPHGSTDADSSPRAVPDGACDTVPLTPFESPIFSFEPELAEDGAAVSAAAALAAESNPISISLRLSRAPSPSLSRKRDTDESYCPARRQSKKSRRGFSSRAPRRRAFPVDFTDDSNVSGWSNSIHGLGLTLEPEGVSHSATMDSDSDDNNAPASSSSSRMSGFFQPTSTSCEGCLDGF